MTSLVVSALSTGVGTSLAAGEPTPPGHSAVSVLIDAAREQAAAGQRSQAAATLERALNIDPRNPWVWHWLATVRLRQGRAAQAEQLARKSSTLPRANAELRAENWRLVARARTMRGNDDGAQAALSKAAALSRR